MRAGFKKSNVMRRTTKAAGSDPSVAVDQPAVIAAEQAQEIGATALAPAHVARVVDEAGEIRVLEINAHRQHVRARRAILQKAAGKVGPFVVVRVAHGAKRTDRSRVVTLLIPQAPKFDDDDFRRRAEADG